jgi:HAD superfamily hydrolase (TIGR01509 family)
VEPQACALLFDIDHTLLAAHEVEERAMQSLAREYGLAVPEIDELTAALGKFRSGACSLDEMLASVFGDIRPRSELILAFKAESLALLPALLEPMPGVRDVLGELAAGGVPLAILTNRWSELQCAKAAQVGFPGPVYCSDAIGAWKPDARAFRLAAESVGFAPEQIVYVGDSPSTDVGGAKRAGMRAVWADLASQPYPAGAAPPDATISDLRQLPAVFGRLSRSIELEAK